MFQVAYKVEWLQNDTFQLVKYEDDGTDIIKVTIMFQGLISDCIAYRKELER